MIIEFSDKDVEKVKEALTAAGVAYELKDSAFESFDGSNIHDTLTAIFERNPEMNGEFVMDEVYRRTPKIVERIRKQWMHDKSYHIEDSPLLELEEKIFDVYTPFIKEELEEIEKEGL
ncbi:hypothetical protein [Proteiniclasticum ruminis]|uniref:Uncharacterized protein n=1 Tax=Proteiniclasticum ruminis TaxID=398199 RepID=A0A1G8I667_9CLOT|nr:hypothetical protein [Proteiniclasticum ruminis]SDI14251.1 hypothetical protein SAMN05421804_101779 [Proteiniclasticum ruminis]